MLAYLSHLNLFSKYSLRAYSVLGIVDIKESRVGFSLSLQLDGENKYAVTVACD